MANSLLTSPIPYDTSINQLHRLSTIIPSSSLNSTALSNDDDAANDDLNLPSVDCSYLLEEEIGTFFNNTGKYTNSFNLLHVNCRSLNANFTGLETLIYATSARFSAIAVTETWLRTSDLDLFKLANFNFYSSARTNNKRGGGVGLFVNENFDANLASNLTINSDDIECIFLTLTPKLIHTKTQTLIGCIYRSPSSNQSKFLSELERMLNTMDLAYKHHTILIAGDFNMDLLKSDTSPAIQEFTDLLSSHSFLPLISKPTRVTQSSTSLIDNIFCNNFMQTISSCIIYNDISDHFPIGAKINNTYVSYTPDPAIPKRIFSKTALNSFCNNLSNYPWHELVSHIDTSIDVNSLYTTFLEIYLMFFNAHFPIRSNRYRKKNSPRQAWITPDIIKSCNTKSKLYKIYKKDPSEKNFSTYKTFCNKLKSTIRTTKYNYYNSRVANANSNSKRLWQIINEVIGNASKNQLPAAFKINEKSTSDLKEIAHAFNDNFSSIGTKLAASIPNTNTHFSSYLRGSFLNSLVLFPTAPQEIIDIVNNFDPKPSAGYDEIPVSVMKQSITFIAEPLAVIFNLSFSTGKVPTSLKQAQICPIHKKGPKSDIGNYRPISLLPSFSKILEKLVYLRLFKYVTKFNILSSNQFGFRPKYSTSMALLELYDRISEAIDSKQFSIGIFIDLQKAFDTVDHKILIEKLRHYGIRGSSLDWFNDYLTNRTQTVKLTNNISSPKIITHGVPQGSILGPLLFILYINDLQNCSSILHFILFADDTNSFYTNNNFNDLLSITNTELAKLFTWFCANKLSLNLSKCCYMLFGNKCKDPVNPDILINDQKLPRVNFIKFLGVYIDDKLTWNHHIKELSSTLSRSLGALNKARFTFSQSTLLILYYTLIYPHLIYGITSWGSELTSKLNCLLLRQKRAVRIISNSPYNAHSDPLFSRLKILKVVDIYKLQTLLLVYKFTHNLHPSDASNFLTRFNFTNILKHYDTRSTSLNLCKYSARTQIRNSTLLFAGPRLWNSLDANLKSIPTISIFKASVSNWLISCYVE